MKVRNETTTYRVRGDKVHVILDGWPGPVVGIGLGAMAPGTDLQVTLKRDADLATMALRNGAELDDVLRLLIRPGSYDFASEFWNQVAADYLDRGEVEGT